jgi:hypothetical protein
MFANLPPDALPDLDRPFRHQVGSDGDLLVFVEGGDAFTMREGRRGDGARGRTDR